MGNAGLVCAVFGIGMDDIYLTCAVVGGTIFCCQLLLSVFGFGGHDMDAGHDIGGGHDVSHDIHDHSGFMSIFTFRAVVAALTFFGLVGLTASRNALGPLIAAGAAVVSGVVAMLTVAMLMRGLSRMTADGTVHIEQCIGKTGSVYLAVPGQKAGSGKVTMPVQDRTMEYIAITAGPEIPTGAKIVVVDVVSADTLEVAAAQNALPSPEPQVSAPKS